MPEGDTIFRAAKTLQRALQGRKISRFETGYAHLANVDDQEPIAGRTIEDVFAVGKHLCFRLSGDLVLRTHMRMNGSWHIYRPGEKWQLARSRARIVIETDAFVAVGFDVPDAQFHSEKKLDRELAPLGPDLLSDTFDEDEALRRMRARAGDIIGDVLLNQRVMAGLGNVYRSEILFLTKTHPLARTGSLDDAKLLEMVRLSRKLLALNVADTKGAGITTRFPFRRTTHSSTPEERLWVYGRGGDPCRVCGTAIQRLMLGVDTRVAYVCPRCQPAAEISAPAGDPGSAPR